MSIFLLSFSSFFYSFLTPYCCCWCWLWLGINLRLNCWLFSFRAAFLSMFENTTETKPPVAVPAPQNVAPLAEPSLRGKVSYITPLCCKPLPQSQTVKLYPSPSPKNGWETIPLGYRLVCRNGILEFENKHECMPLFISFILCMMFKKKKQIPGTCRSNQGMYSYSKVFYTSTLENANIRW